MEAKMELAKDLCERQQREEQSIKLYTMGLEAFQAREYGKAESCLKEAVGVESRNACAWMLLGAVEEKCRKLPEAAAANDMGALPEAILAADAMIAQAQQAGAIPECMKALEALLPAVESKAVSVRLCQGMAATLCAAKEFDGCMRIMNKAESLAEKPEALKEMPWGFLRATALIGLERLDDARTLLEAMEQWNAGAEEDHARAAFLIGWIYLQQNDRDKALSTLKAGIEKYPASTFAAKAKQIVQRLQAM